jgi:hypothetical protein
MTVKDLRNMLKGIPGNVSIEEGNMQYWSMSNCKNNQLHIDIYSNSILFKGTDKISKVILWFEE